MMKYGKGKFMSDAQSFQVCLGKQTNPSNPKVRKQDLNSSLAAVFSVLSVCYIPQFCTNIVATGTNMYGIRRTGNNMRN